MRKYTEKGLKQRLVENKSVNFEALINKNEVSLYSLKINFSAEATFADFG